MSSIANWIANHKKLTSTIIGAILQLIPDKYMSMEQRIALGATIISYVIAQGAADIGKEAKKIEVENKTILVESSAASEVRDREKVITQDIKTPEANS